MARDLTRAVERAVGRGVPGIRSSSTRGSASPSVPSTARRRWPGVATLAALGRPVLVGPSRKSFLAAAAGGAPAAARDWPTAAAVTAAVLAGAHIVRVHAVAEMVQVVRAADMIRSSTARRAGRAAATARLRLSPSPRAPSPACHVLARLPAGRPPVTGWDLLDIAIVAIVVYELLKLIRGTRASQMAVAIGAIVGAVLRVAGASGSRPSTG